jgi:serine protease inhibitor
MAARATTERFVVTHPFLYFVLDTDTHIALMAGKIVDPLNSRIY